MANSLCIEVELADPLLRYARLCSRRCRNWPASDVGVRLCTERACCENTLRCDAPLATGLYSRGWSAGDDAEKSLAAVTVGESTRESLARIGDDEIGSTLGHVGFAHGSTENGDADATTSYVVGSTTSDSQRFRILRPHAQGGLGAVFVALDSELNREVALKQILERHADDPVSRHRFLLEAEITGGLEHPGIAPVHGLGTYDGGRPYYTMRFIRGDSLKDAIATFHRGARCRQRAGDRTF